MTLVPLRHHDDGRMSELLRSREGKGHGKVTYIELFFDLVFVFAVTQVSHTLMGDFTVRGGLHALISMLAMWWLWIYTSWFTNWLDPEKIPVRLALLGLMLGGLIFSSSLPHAFGSHGWYFAGAYVASSVGRSLFFIRATRGHPTMVRNFQRIVLWQIAAAVLWLTGAAFEGDTRMILWAIGLTIDTLGPMNGFRVPGLGRSATTDWDVEGGHMAERCALFIIIALGESVLVTGAMFSELAWTGATVGAFVVSFIGSVAMWWIYFDAGAEAGSRQIERSEDPGKLARLAYTYFHLFLVAAVILAAVADEFVLHHPLGHAEGKVTIAVLGSAALYLIGTALFKRTIAGRFATSHGLALVALAGLAVAAPQLSPLLLSTGASLVLVAVAVMERRARCLVEEE